MASGHPKTRESPLHPGAIPRGAASRQRMKSLLWRLTARLFSNAPAPGAVKKFEFVNPGGVSAVTVPDPDPVSRALTLSVPALIATGVVIVAPAMFVLIATDTGESPPASC